MKRLLLALLIVLPVVAQRSSPTQSLSSARNAVGMEFVKIAPGEFMMGCSAGDSDCDADEKPEHRVQISKAFEIGKYEVTQAQWQTLMGSNPSTIKGDDHPVETVSKQDAEDFLAQLTAQNDGYRYRLPTEAEWEYAARAGAPLPTSLDEVAWYSANSGDTTHAVGQKKPNAWGVYDMLGNVREWVSDQYAMNYYANSPLADPTGPQPGQGGQQRGNFGRGRRFDNGPPNGQPNNVQPDNSPSNVPIAYHPANPQDQQGGPPQGNYGRGFGGGGGRQVPIMRGGAWDNPSSFVRVSARYHYYGPTLKLSDIGFRAVREPM